MILVRPNINTADVGGFAACAGILTAVGGRTAHAALVARQLGKPCIVGCAALEVDPARHKTQLAGCDLHEGDWLSLDGESGQVFLGRGAVAIEAPQAELAEIGRWKQAETAQPAA